MAWFCSDDENVRWKLLKKSHFNCLALYCPHVLWRCNLDGAVKSSAVKSGAVKSGAVLAALYGPARYWRRCTVLKSKLLRLLPF